MYYIFDVGLSKNETPYWKYPHRYSIAQQVHRNANKVQINLIKYQIGIKWQLGFVTGLLFSLGAMGKGWLYN